MNEYNVDDKNSESIKRPDDVKTGKVAGIDKNDTEYSTEFTADELINPDSTLPLKKDNMHYISEIQAMPESIKALIIISWISAALAGFVSIYFAIPGIVSAYAANRVLPGAGRAALLTNIILAIANLILSFAFLQTVRNIFALL